MSVLEREIVTEPELRPYFKIDLLAHAVRFECRTCEVRWLYTDPPNPPRFDAECENDFPLDNESRNALLAHARSHRAPRLTEIKS